MAWAEHSLQRFEDYGTETRFSPLRSSASGMDRLSNLWCRNRRASRRFYGGSDLTDRAGILEQANPDRKSAIALRLALGLDVLAVAHAEDVLLALAPAVDLSDV